MPNYDQFVHSHKIAMLSPALLLSTTPQGCFQTQFKQVTSRKLLGHAHALFNQYSAPASSPAAATTASSSTSGQESTAFSSINANVVMILAVLLCALICALIVNTLVRCVCGIASRAWFEPEDDSSSDTGHPCASESQVSARVWRKRAVRSLPCFAYPPGALGILLHSGTECAICLSEFVPGERVRVLPKCGHAFHVRCIDRWLASQSSCPTCRQSLFGDEQEAGRPPTGPGNSERVTDEYREEVQ